MAEIGGRWPVSQDSGPLCGEELRDRRRQQQQRGGEDRRDDARGVELQRQVRGLALEHAVADLALRILDQQPALARSKKTMAKTTTTASTSTKTQDQHGRDRAVPAKLEGLRRCACGKSATMPDEDDQRDAVADAARGDLLAEPHQEHGAAGQRDHGGDAEEQARIEDDVLAALEPDGDAVGLERREHDGQVARVLVEDLAALLAFLLQRLERRRDGGQRAAR